MYIELKDTIKMKKWEKFKKSKLGTTILIIIHVVVGLQFLLAPSTVLPIVIRLLGFLWFADAMNLFVSYKLREEKERLSNLKDKLK